jgi:ribosomal protein L11 methyltransferase
MPWQQLTLQTTQKDTESLSDLLTELGASAVTCMDAEDHPLLEPGPGETPLWPTVTLTALFELQINSESVINSLHTQYDEQLSVSCSILEDQDWERVCMDQFQPMSFGQHLWIVPSWHEPPEPQACNILLDPGLAFGTGSHPTTALCLKWLDRHPPEQHSVIDYGCGSGILAIAADKLGATSVTAIDNDPQALIACQENSRRNHSPINTALPEQLSLQPVDLLLANILANPLVRLSADIAKRVKTGGYIVLSGILNEQQSLIIEAYTLQGFQNFQITEDAGWLCLSAQKKDLSEKSK